MHAVPQLPREGPLHRGGLAAVVTRPQGQGGEGLKVEGGKDIHVDFGAVSVILRVLRQKSGCVEERCSLVKYSFWAQQWS